MFDSWRQIAQRLEDHKARSEEKFGTLDDVLLGRYLAGETTPEESREVERSLKAHPALARIAKLVCPELSSRLKLPKNLGIKDIDFPDDSIDDSTTSQLPRRYFDPMKSVEGFRIAGYEIVAPIGRGGMGSVYKVRDVKLDQVFALKLITASHLGADIVSQLMVEAQACKDLSHDGIISIVEVGESKDHLFVVMDYVNGPTLREYLHERPLEQRRAAEILAAIADAVAYLHSRGVVHRDLKPSNIVLEGGEPRITDLGLALRASDGNYELSGQVVGTVPYMSPEQASGIEAGPLSDVYSLGVILYEAIAGRRPYHGLSQAEMMYSVINAVPPPPRQINESISKDLEAICLKCLSRKPGDRYESAKDFAADLRAFLDGWPTEARPMGWLERAWLWCVRQFRST